MEWSMDWNELYGVVFSVVDCNYICFNFNPFHIHTSI